jgi:uncharacterized protein (DUF983 family)
MTFAPLPAAAADEEPARDTWLAMKRGFLERCPNCGKGRMFGRYLKVNAECPACHEELHHQRADDAPPYFTIVIVGHIVGAAMLAVEEINDALPLWLHAIVWPLFVVALSLALLPRIKGALIAYQWALRMHGFGKEDADGQDGRRIGGPAAA